MSEEKQPLVEFAQHVKWEKYVTDPTIAELLEKIKSRIAELDKPSNTNETAPAAPEKKTEELQTRRVKLVVVGDGAVGKTSLLIRFATGEFPTEYLPTVFENYTAQMKRETDIILLHLWDTAGQEDYDRLRPLSYPNSDVILLCFSTISKASFEAIKEKWAPEVHHYVPGVPSILVGTKIDLRESKTPDPHSGKYDPITPQQGKEMAAEIKGAKYMEISSKEGTGINELFAEAVDMVVETREQKDKPNADPKKAGAKKKKDGCVLL